MSNNNQPTFPPPPPCGIITLSTDFGISDSYAGALKGVLLSVNPGCRPIDLTHALAPQDVQAGSFHLTQACPFFPTGTVHLAVVDPGVGTERRPIIVVTEKYFFVGPDNGLFSGIMQGGSNYFCFEPINTQYFLSPVSSTFHGRDIFAPVAAYLTHGIAPAAMGRKIEDPVLLALPAPPTEENNCLTGSIVHIDHYGNLITNIPQDRVLRIAECGQIMIACNDTVIRKLYTAYAQADENELFGIIGSGGMLEISAKNNSARLATGALRSQRVSVSADPP
jgi:S-adenosylmethionine hydrolase